VSCAFACIPKMNNHAILRSTSVPFGHSTAQTGQLLVSARHLLPGHGKNRSGALARWTSASQGLDDTVLAEEFPRMEQ
jgi:hypothetical protein